MIKADSQINLKDEILTKNYAEEEANLQLIIDEIMNGHDEYNVYFIDIYNIDYIIALIDRQKL